MRRLENIRPGQSKSTKLPERKHSLRHKLFVRKLIAHNVSLADLVAENEQSSFRQDNDFSELEPGFTEMQP
jgi:hypothetical protein